MLETLLAHLRGRRRDRAKATDQLTESVWSSYRELMEPYDAPLIAIEHISEPALVAGIATDSDEREIPLRLPCNDASAMTLVVGGTGTGKSTFAEHLLWQFLKHRRPVGAADFKSGAYQNILRILGAHAYSLPEPEQRAFIDRITAMDLFADTLVPLNICASLPWMSRETQSYEMALILTRLFDSAMSAQMENILRNLLLLLIEMKLTLAETPVILRDESILSVLAERSEQRSVKDFFLHTYPQLASNTKTALRSRLEALLLAENLRCMLGADECLNFKDILDRGHPLIMFLGKGPIPEELVDVFGSLSLQLLFGAGYAAASTRRPYQFIADEFFHLLDGTNLEKRFTTGLVSFRSFNFFLTLIMHQFTQVPSKLREAILANCDLMALFRTSGRNASFVGDFLPDIDPTAIREAIIRTGQIPDTIKAKQLEKLERLPNRHLFWYDRRKSYRAIRLQVPDVQPPHHMIGISERELTRFIEDNNIGRSGVSRSELLAQIARREHYLHDLVRPPIRVAPMPPAPQPAPSQSTEPEAPVEEPLATPELQPGATKKTKRKPRIG